MKVMRQLNKFAAGSAAVAVAAIASVGIAQADGMPSKGGLYTEVVGLEWLLLRCALRLAVVEHGRQRGHHPARLR